MELLAAVPCVATAQLEMAAEGELRAPTWLVPAVQLARFAIICTLCASIHLGLTPEQTLHPQVTGPVRLTGALRCAAACVAALKNKLPEVLNVVVEELAAGMVALANANDTVSMASGHPLYPVSGCMP